MARLFVGADQILCSIGANGPVGSGSYTLMWLYKISQFSGVGGLGSLLQGASRVRQGVVTNNNRLFGTGDFSNGFPVSPLPEDTWIWAAQSKAAGAAHYTWAVGLYPIVDPNVDIQFGESVGSGNHSDPGVGDGVAIGQADVQGSRTIAVQSFFAPQLTQAQIKTAFTTQLRDIINLGPTGTWALNQANATDSVPDVSNHGANSTSVNGTTIVANPPGYDFSLASLVTGTAAVNLGALNAASAGTVTRIGTATVNLGRLISSASAITGGPVTLPDDFYSPGPCRPYDWTGFCVPVPVGSAAVSGDALRAASEIIYYASGQRFDTCQVTIRPCRKSCYGEDWNRFSAGWWEFGGGPVPALINGLWYNVACGVCGTNCSCSIVSETLLPGPVREIVQVTVDGEVLVNGTDYRLDDYRKLVRLGGEQWPLCNDLTKGIIATGTWSVTAIYGEPLPTLGKFAVGELLCQIIADVLGQDCQLPDNVTNITRQGLSFTLDDVNELLKTGFTGLKYVDQFIQRYNPNKLQARAKLYDVDSPDYRVTGTVIS